MYVVRRKTYLQNKALARPVSNKLVLAQRQPLQGSADVYVLRTCTTHPPRSPRCLPSRTHNVPVHAWTVAAATSGPGLRERARCLEPAQKDRGRGAVDGILRPPSQRPACPACAAPCEARRPTRGRARQKSHPSAPRRRVLTEHGTDGDAAGKGSQTKKTIDESKRIRRKVEEQKVHGEPLQPGIESSTTSTSSKDRTDDTRSGRGAARPQQPAAYLDAGLRFSSSI